MKATTGLNTVYRLATLGLLLLLSHLAIAQPATQIGINKNSIAGSQGIDVSYFIPNQQKAINKDAKLSTPDYEGYYFLGGMRLKLGLLINLRQLSDVASVKWQINASSPVPLTPTSSRLCDDFFTCTGNYRSGSYEKTMAANSLALGYAIYVEPELWSNSNEMYVTATINYKLALGRPATIYSVLLKTRELQPATPPMEGSDVAMLEAMLWQLGLSPQKRKNKDNPFSGSEGARIATNRNSNSGSGAVTTTDCQTPAKVALTRGKFHSGWLACRGGDVSTEIMIRRFQARNNVPPSAGGKVSDALIGAQTGRLDSGALSFLKRDWLLYLKAFIGNPYRVADIHSTSAATWLQGAIDVWDNGDGHNVPSNVYTASRHTDILTVAGVIASSATDRSALLQHWAGHESRYQWGNNAKGYQQTDYRMTEGGADEHGSLGFSQLLYAYRFGHMPCAAQVNSGLNIYHPEDNLKSFVTHTASDASAGIYAKCHGHMYKAFIDNSLRTTFANDTTRINGVAANVNDLKGYRHAAGGIQLIGAQEDNYEVLAKAIMGYNGGNGVLSGGHSYAKFLKYREYDKKSQSNSSKVCHSCRYAIDIREPIFNAGHLRTYIWKGGVYPPTHAKAGQDWCFAYGEKEWVDGKIFVKVQEAADNFDLAGRPQIPVGQVPCP